MDLFDLAAKITLDSSEYEKGVSKSQTSSTNLGKALENVASQSETMRNKIEVLGTRYTEASKKVEELTEKFNKAAKETGTDSKETQELAEELANAEKEMRGLAGELEKYNPKLEESSEKTSKFADTLKNGLANAAKIGAAAIGAAAAAATAAIGAAAAGITNLTKSAVDGFANYEQLVGGVETLFGTGGMGLQEYADSVGKSVTAVKGEYERMQAAQETVLANADNAWQTAGMSANEYMETVTGMSASLIQSLDGDTQAAAEYADMAIIDMSDNANKMGTSMESISTAYAGFAKQNYTMLDNLNTMGALAA